MLSSPEEDHQNKLVVTSQLNYVLMLVRFKDDKVIRHGDEMEGDTSKYVIPRVTLADSGEYKCRAVSSQLMKVSTEAEVVITGQKIYLETYISNRKSTTE